MDLHTREFIVNNGPREVPAVLWRRLARQRHSATVLLGHGGSQHKTHPGIEGLARRLVLEHGLSVVCIDGPIHGARRADGKHGLEVQSEFAAMWEATGLIDEMVGDWKAVIGALDQMDDVSTAALGWYGVSMGTAYGLPLCAVEPRIKAALLGMWGMEYTNGTPVGHAKRLARAASATLEAEVLFQIKWDDQFFTRQGEVDLFGALASSQKWLKSYPGAHVPADGEQMDDVIAFLAKRLTALN